MAEFSKPRRSRDEPAGLDAFAAGGAGVAHQPRPRVRVRMFGMNVKFTAEAKAALEKLAASEQRSQQQIITRLLEPVLIDAAREL